MEKRSHFYFTRYFSSQSKVLGTLDCFRGITEIKVFLIHSHLKSLYVRFLFVFSFSPVLNTYHPTLCNLLKKNLTSVYKVL